MVSASSASLPESCASTGWLNASPATATEISEAERNNAPVWRPVVNIPISLTGVEPVFRPQYPDRPFRHCGRQFNENIANDIVDNLVANTQSAFMSQPAAAKPPAASDIADWIRSQIRAARFVPGQRLVEVDLIRQTGGSRFKVREALQRLEAEGLVEIEEFRGASVREASMEEVRQLYRARAALEGICAADFTLRATEQDKAQLRALAEAMEQCVDSASHHLFGSLNSQWHSLIMQVTGNTVIEGLVRRLNTPVHHLLFETFYRGERLRAAVADHRLIMEAVLAGDPAAAEAAMRQHIENGHSFLTTLDAAMHPVD
jgi:DNA-binding GntR family transcriptional regulator